MQQAIEGEQFEELVTIFEGLVMECLHHSMEKGPLLFGHDADFEVEEFSSSDEHDFETVCVQDLVDNTAGVRFDATVTNTTSVGAIQLAKCIFTFLGQERFEQTILLSAQKLCSNSYGLTHEHSKKMVMNWLGVPMK